MYWIYSYRFWAEMYQIRCHAGHCSFAKCCAICLPCFLVHSIHHFNCIFKLLSFDFILKLGWKSRLKFYVCTFTIISLYENFATVLKQINLLCPKQLWLISIIIINHSSKGLKEPIYTCVEIVWCVVDDDWPWFILDVWLLGGLRPPEIASSFALVVIVDEKIYLKKETKNDIFIQVLKAPHILCWRMHTYSI